MPWPFATLADFVEAHRWVDDRVKAYLEAPRARYARTAAGVAPELRLDVAYRLHANNHEARNTFARAAVELASEHPGLNRGEVFLVTFVPAVFAFPLGDHEVPDLVLAPRRRSAPRSASRLAEAPRVRDLAAQAAARRAGPAARVDLVPLQALVRDALAGLPLLGMVEAALYRAWGPGGRTVDHVAWHTHALVWNTTRAALDARLRELGDNHINLMQAGTGGAQRGCAVHVKRVYDLTGALLYILKAPMQEVRVNRRPERVNPETGEVFPADLRQQKRKLRTGERVRLLDILHERRLADLLFSGGSGRALARAIRQRARGANQ